MSPGPTAECPHRLNPPPDSVQPPNMTHAVHNPVSAICEGGHFYTYACLPLTHRGIYVDRIFRENTTNDTHAMALPTLWSMAEALGRWDDKGEVRLYSRLTIAP